MSNQTPDATLVVIDVQTGFDDNDFWGPSTNPGCEDNIERLMQAWTTQGRGPIVVVRHDSERPSPLHPDQPGNRLKHLVESARRDLLVAKTVNSAFLGQPDLRTWLDAQGIRRLVLTGIQTNMCVETTARMGGNLGFDVTVPIDATRTFDLSATRPDGQSETVPARELMRITALNLQGGRFAQITTTGRILQYQC